MKSLRLYLIVAGLLLVIYIIAQINRPKVIDWTENLSNKEKTPFGTYILYNRLKDVFARAEVMVYRQPLYNVIAEDSIKNASYIIICPGMDLAKPDFKQLKKYVQQGNDVFIASAYFGTIFEHDLHISTQEDYKLTNRDMPVNFTSKYLSPAKHYTIDKGIGNLYFSNFDTLHAVVLGENINHKANFIKYTFGKGSLYLICNPKFFSNYSLLKPSGAAYAATALLYVKNTKKVIFDEYYSQGDEDADSFMRVFLNKPALEWAYYITIFSLIIFVLFEMKRRQRIIPVIEPLANSTLDFVNVVGQVYYEKRDNTNIAHKKILYFLTYLRDEHHVKTNKLNSELVEKLATKLDLKQEFATQLVDYFSYISNQTHVTDGELIQLNQLIEQFYIKSR